jgi:hypothetical protein
MKRYPHLIDFQEACSSLCSCPTSMQRRRSGWHAAEKHADAWSCRPPSGRPWTGGNDRPRWPQGSRGGDGLSCCWRLDTPNPLGPRWSGSSGASCAHGPGVFSPNASTGLRTPLAAGPGAGFPPEVAIHGGRLACERPDPLGRSLSPWDGPERARQLVADGVVEDIAAATVRRMLAAHQLQPWRQPVWLYPTPPREAACYATVSARHDRSTRPLRPDALVLSVAAKTALQPRPRCAPTLPAQPHHRPHRVEHEDTRAGARHLCAALATRSGQVSGRWDERKRQREGLAFLQTLEPEIDESIRTMHLVCAHVSPQHGQDVRIWFNHQPRVVVHFPPRTWFVDESRRTMVQPPSTPAPVPRGW